MTPTRFAIDVGVCGASAAAIFWRARRGGWTPQFIGATFAIGLFIVTTAAFSAHAWLAWKPSPGAWVDFPPVVTLIWISALPIQTVFNFLFGEDNFFEEYLLLTTALLMWCAVGSVIGALLARFKKHVDTS